MSKQNTGENEYWTRLLVAVAALGLVVLMACAMFTTQDGSNSQQRPYDSYGLGGQFGQFQNNVGKSLPQGFGEIL